ncbi:MAG: ATP-grasp domain-containing protein [Candidatus Zixiibacteriota bacterium]|nr:MAG: ATP-grasp domain-containing protein [candidate division Zixibacteria bacterium]
MKIAVVRNRSYDGVFSRLGQPCPERYGRRSVQSVLNALRTGGHTVEVFEGDVNLLVKLQEFIPPDPVNGQSTGMVFNLAYGIQGDARYSQVPGILEMAGIPYTGPGPQSHAICLDKYVTKLLLQHHGILTPRFKLVAGSKEPVEGLRYPLIVKPRHESTSLGIRVVNTSQELEAAVEAVLTEFQQEALVEEYIDGREVAIGLLGTKAVEVLPAVELVFDEREIKVLTKPDKFHRSDTEPRKICPAPMDEDMTTRLQEVAITSYRICDCRDYARIDIRLDHDGNPYVLEINSMATLGRKGGFVLAARKAGYSFKRLIWHIVDLAHERYFGCPAQRGFDIDAKVERNSVRAGKSITHPSESDI